MRTRREFLNAAAAVPAAALVVGRSVAAPAAAQAPAAAAPEADAQAQAMFGAMQAMLGRTYTDQERERVMRRLSGAVRQHAQMNDAGLTNGDEPVTVFNPVTPAMMTPKSRPAPRRVGRGARE